MHSAKTSTLFFSKGHVIRWIRLSAWLKQTVENGLERKGRGLI